MDAYTFNNTVNSFYEYLLTLINVDLNDCFPIIF